MDTTLTVCGRLRAFCRQFWSHYLGIPTDGSATPTDGWHGDCYYILVKIKLPGTEMFELQELHDEHVWCWIAATWEPEPDIAGYRSDN